MHTAGHLDRRGEGRKNRRKVRKYQAGGDERRGREEKTKEKQR